MTLVFDYKAGTVPPWYFCSVCGHQGTRLGQHHSGLFCHTCREAKRIQYTAAIPKPTEAEGYWDFSYAAPRQVWEWWLTIIRVPFRQRLDEPLV